MRLQLSALLLAGLVCLPLCSARAQDDTNNPPLPKGAKERPLAFVTDDLTAPGTLTLPAHSEVKPPIVVLVGGSGIQDRDGTIGPNKFLQQLAFGLAARGIASLRYDRRPKFSLSSFLAHQDLDHEVVIDAANALKFVTVSVPEVDSHEVFLVGHSLGAELAPDIVAMQLKRAPGSVQGMALLSGVARPIDVVMAEQIRTLGANQDATPAEIEPIVDAWSDVWKEAKDPKTPDDKQIGVGTLLPARYWRDWLRRDPLATMKTLDIPVFVSRGSKDVNSTHADFLLLSKGNKTTAEEFHGLNHIYMPIGSVANGADILQPGTVSPEFLDALAAWIMKTAGK